MNDEHTFFVQCIRNSGELLGEPFRLRMPITTYVSDIKELVKDKKAPELDHIAADRLILWKLKEPRDDITGQFVVSDSNAERLKPTAKISNGLWQEGLVHVLAQLPAPEAGTSECIGTAVYSY